MPDLRVLVLYNEPLLPENHPDVESEQDAATTAESVRQVIEQAGHEVECLGLIHEPDRLVAELRGRRPDVVFNLFEGTPDLGCDEAYAAGVLDWLGIPFTGCPPQALYLARVKPLTKYALAGAGLPTPGFFVVEHLPAPTCRLPWPVIVKPAVQDASVGLDQGSVVRSQKELRARVEYLFSSYGPVLVEQYIPGREFNVGIIEAPELRILPISEIVFADRDQPGYWPIVTYDAKWRTESREYQATVPSCPARIRAELARKLGQLAVRAFRLLGCRDYARVDFRVDAVGQPYILEINPNPDYSPTAGLARNLAAAGISHQQFTLDLLHAALARGRQSRVPVEWRLPCLS
jgi:D-alanine-D-alanine ligase